MIKCPNCGTSRVHINPSPFCEVCGASLFESSSVSATLSIPKGIPWEHIEHLNIIKAFLSTVSQCMFTPLKFFKQVTEKSSLFHALLFGLVCGSIGLIFDIVWQNSVMNFWNMFVPYGIETDISGLRPTSLIFSPMILSLHIFILAVYIHFLLIITKGKHSNFQSTITLVCYTQSVAVLSIIPHLGNVIAPLWALYLLITGTSCIHKISRTRSCLTILSPFILVLLLSVFFLIAVMSGGILISTILKEIIPFFR